MVNCGRVVAQRHMSTSDLSRGGPRGQAPPPDMSSTRLKYCFSIGNVGLAFGELHGLKLDLETRNPAADRINKSNFRGRCGTVREGCKKESKERTSYIKN